MRKEETRLPKALVDRIRREVPILELMARYGVETQTKGKNHFAKCPFHDDGEASLSVDPAKNVWHCFGCDKGGSIYDFVMEKEGLTFKEAASKLLIESGNGRIKTCAALGGRAAQLEQPKKQEEIAPAMAQSACREFVEPVLNYYHRTLFGPNSKGMDYLKSRGLADTETLEAFQVGFADGTLTQALPKESIEPLKQIGLLRKDGREFFTGCLVVPAYRGTAMLGEVYGRRIQTLPGQPSHLYLPGPHRGVMNAKAAEVFDEIILTEAALDALALYAIDHRNVIPCYGTGGFTQDHRELFKKHHIKKVYIAFDNDQAGENAARKLARELDASGIEAHQIHFPKGSSMPTKDGSAPGGKDANDYVRLLRRQGMRGEELTKAFAELQRHAPRIGYRRERASKLTLTEQTEDALHFSANGGLASGGQNGHRHYRLRGLFDNNATSLRVVLTACRHDGHPCRAGAFGEGGHTDRFDLYTAKSRLSFAHRVANRLEIPAAKVEEDLNQLIPLLETIRAETSTGTEEKKTPTLTPSEEREALQLLRSANLLERVAADLETVGYIGEEQNKQLAYLIATSRKLNKPLSAIVRSDSGAGKSYLMECVAELMPPEEVQYFSRLTPQSLYYMGQDELVHKLLIVDERDGSEESEYPIRTLQTRRKLTLAVPMKDPSTGRIKTKMLEINGPIAYMESSTQQSINPENLNRCFELYLDDSPKQTTRIMSGQRKARTLSGLNRDSHKEKTLRLHRNAQRLLRPLKVVIPFAEALTFPSQWLRTRRDHERFLSLVEIVAFLRQHQRKTQLTAEACTPGPGVEYIEATVEDYATAYDLARTAFTNALQDLGKPARDLLEHIKAMVKAETERLNIKTKDHWFTRRNIREYTRWPDHSIKRTIRQLEDLEYLDVRRSAQGGSHRYRLASPDGEAAVFDGLTTPDALRKMFKTVQSGTSGTKVGQAPKSKESTVNER